MSQLGGLLTLGLAGLLALVCAADGAADPKLRWTIGEPIATYWAGPQMTEATAKQMRAGGFNLVWCTEAELDVALRFGLRAQLTDPLLSPATLDNAEKRAELDALVARVRRHPALYSYFIVDEPSAAAFEVLGRLVSYLREKDPAHLAYINLFPTYASNEQLGTEGDTVAAYNEHLRLYIEQVKPDLVSYDHYHFAVSGDGNQYFLNLAMIRRAALEAGVPFLNIVQASSWDPAMRVPNGREMSFLVYTSLAYGAQGISYFVYYYPSIIGGIADSEGRPTSLYRAVRPLNREFVAIARELQPLTSIGAYHLGMVPPGAEALPEDAAFRIEPLPPTVPYRTPVEGLLLGCFGAGSRPTHVVVVNLDYRAPVETTLVGPGPLQVFDARAERWLPEAGSSIKLKLRAGGGKLVRLANR